MKLFGVVLACLAAGSARADYFSFGEDGAANTSPNRPSSANSCNCGWVNRERIVGGRETGRNEYPMMAGLQKRSTGFQFCGATVISEWHIITAAHCTEGYKASDLRVSLGNNHIKGVGDSGRLVLNVAEIVDHEGYTPKPANRDISLLVTERRIPFNKIIGPACLPTRKMYLAGEIVKVLGWGRTSDNGTASDLLREVDLPIIPFRTCKASWPNAQEDTMVCTAGGDTDSCKGDSGGPLIWLDPRTQRYALVGLVSYGGKCAGGKPAVNTDVGAYLPWIREKAQATKPGTVLCTSI